MYDEFKELLSIFNAHRVKYLIVGGYAVGFHSQPRATKDLDVWIKPDADNAKAVYEALTEFGAPLNDLKPTDFAKPGEFFRIGHHPVMVDLLLDISGIEFDQAWERRVEAVIDQDAERTAFFISASDLVTSKLAVGTPQDIADVTAIRTTKKSS